MLDECELLIMILKVFVECPLKSIKINIFDTNSQDSVRKKCYTTDTLQKFILQRNVKNKLQMFFFAHLHGIRTRLLNLQCEFLLFLFTFSVFGSLYSITQ